MFVFNVSIKKSKALKIFICIVSATIIISLIFGIYSLRNKTKREFVNYNIKNADIAEIAPENYTSILKNSYENMDAYVGKKIKFSGFVYRLYDFNESQFVLGREMIVSQTSQTQAQVVVVGFLCNLKGASAYEDGSWVEIEGTIQKGYYHSEIPIIEVTNITTVNCPENPYVYPPDSGYVKTETI